MYMYHYIYIYRNVRGEWQCQHSEYELALCCSGCGSASGNAYCSNKGGCIDTDDYSADYDDDAFSAEVGDWNGKYGLITVNDSTGLMYRMDSSYFEVTPDDMDILNMSVVFHCNDGSRAFCAPFVESSAETNYSVPEQGMLPLVT